LALLARPNEKYPFDRFLVSEDPRSRRLEVANEPSDEETEARLLAEKETTGTKLEGPLNGLKEDIQAKWDNFSALRFQISYPMTRRMFPEQSTSFKETNNWSGKESWRKDYHKALIDNLECNDYNLYTPKDIEKTSHTKSEKDFKKNAAKKSL
jgi:hypothetical protein